MKNNYKEIYSKENSSRTAAFKKDIYIKNIIELMNDELVSSHEKMLKSRNELNELNCPPLILPFGLPRSGTTLLTQVVTQYFDVGYVDNLISRFWKSPLYGIALSKEVLKKEDSSFSSSLGQTSEPTAPHEFSYFWLDKLKGASLNGVDVEKLRNDTDWGDIAKILCNMSYEFNKPLAMKGMWPAYAMDKIREVMPKTFFIYIKRDPIDVAISIYHARIAYYGSHKTWWATYPPEYKQLMDKNWPEQIAGQIFYLNSFFEKQLSDLPPESYASITYSDLCNNPRQTMNDIQEKIINYSGYDLKISTELPKSFSFRKSDKSFDDANELLKSVKAVFETDGASL